MAMQKRKAEMVRPTVEGQIDGQSNDEIGMGIKEVETQVVRCRTVSALR